MAGMAGVYENLGIEGFQIGSGKTRSPGLVWNALQNKCISEYVKT